MTSITLFGRNLRRFQICSSLFPGLIIVVLLVVDWFWFRSMFPTTYTWTELMINYAGGFCRRGLLGSIAWNLHPWFPAHDFLCDLVLALYLATTLLIIRLIHPCEWFPKLLFLFSPAGLLFPVLAPEAYGRKDVLILLAFAWSAFISTSGRSFKSRAILISALYLITALVVETALFYAPLAFVLLFHSSAPSKGTTPYLKWAGLLIATAGLFFAFMLSTGNPDGMQIVNSWRAFYPGTKPIGAFIWIGANRSDLFQFALDNTIRNRVTLQSYALSAALALVPMAALFQARKFPAKSPFLPVIVASAILFSLLSFCVAADWGRCIYLLSIHVFLLFFLVTKPRQETGSEIETKRLKILLFQAAFLLIFASSWRMKAFVHQGESAIFPEGIFRLHGADNRPALPVPRT